MANIQLAANLRYLRELHNQSQKDLEAVFSISRQTFSNYENKVRTPDLDMLIRIASYYHLTLDQLINQNLEHPTPGAENMPRTGALHKESGNTLYLTEEEIDLIMKYRNLSDADRSLLLGFTDSRC